MAKDAVGDARIGRQCVGAGGGEGQDVSGQAGVGVVGEGGEGGRNGDAAAVDGFVG